MSLVQHRFGNRDLWDGNLGCRLRIDSGLLGQEHDHSLAVGHRLKQFDVQLLR